jgi:hypothetical protein
MTMKHYWMAAAALFSLAAAPAQALDFINNLQVANGTDLSGLGGLDSRLGGFGSDLVYDPVSKTYFGLTDRGPGGGVLSYAPRIQQFSLNTNPTTGFISDFALVNTIMFKQADGVSFFNGLNPQLLNGAVGALGASFDPEGLVRLPNGHFLVSDEYGPSLYEFDATGVYVRAFATPDNLKPRAGANLDYVNDRSVINSGRQDNRGFEGLTLSPDGTKAYAVLQDPLVNEGSSNDGRRSRNVRMVEFDVATGNAERQFVYRLEDRDQINDRIPGSSNDFSATNQGRSIGVSSLIALPDGHHFLVLERDNRGLGVDDPTAAAPVGSKRIFLIDIAGATDVSGTSMAGANGLPVGVSAVSKALWLDIQAAIAAAGLTVPEKIEGLSFGPDLLDGGISLLLITDNDFSVTQNGGVTQFDVCTSGAGGTSQQVALGALCPSGLGRIPNNLYAFRLDYREASALGVSAVPEPESWALMIGGFALAGAAMRRRARLARAAAR